MGFGDGEVCCGVGWTFRVCGWGGVEFVWGGVDWERGVGWKGVCGGLGERVEEGVTRA